MRHDVLALTADALAALTNRGLVKRATKEVEAAPPAVAEEPDGTLRGACADGAAPVLPTGGLERASCTCGALGVCRHVLGLILAYQAGGAAEEAPDRVVDWSPGRFDDEQLAERIGPRMLAAARRARRAGYHARVYRPSAADPAARVDLGSATVRFLVPDDLGFVHTDAVAGARDDVIALAVWAFRVADEQTPGEPDVQVDVGEPEDRGAGRAGRRGKRRTGEVADEGDGGTRRATALDPGGQEAGGGEARAGERGAGGPAADPAPGGREAGGGKARAGEPGAGGPAGDRAPGGREADGGETRAGEPAADQVPDGREAAGGEMWAGEGQAGGPAAGREPGRQAAGGEGARPGARGSGDAAARRDAGGSGPGHGTGHAGGPAAGGRKAWRGADELDAGVSLADEVLLGGAIHLGAGFGARVADVRRRLERAGLRWPLHAVGELAEQLEAYRERGSGYTPERVAELVGELHARARAARGGPGRARVLGTEEAAETPLRRVRLDGLGCRVVAAGSAERGDERRIVEVYLAHADSATVLVLRRAWDGDEPGAALGRRRLAGSSVAGLAAGTLVTESAVRSASRAVRLTTSRVAKATVTASRGAWGGLPDALLVRDLAALAAELDRLPPRVVRPRIEAELVRVLEVAEVRAVTYAPGAQRLEAVLADRHGNPATLAATHTAAAPGRLDALAASLAAIAGNARGPGAASPQAASPQAANPHDADVQDAHDAKLHDAYDAHDAHDAHDAYDAHDAHDAHDANDANDANVQDVDGVNARDGKDAHDAVIYVSGVVRRAQGGIEIDPLAIAGGGRVVVPDLAEADRRDIGPRWAGREDPVQVALDHAIATLAEMPHRGVRHLPPGFGDRLRKAGDGLNRTGLYQAAAAVERLRTALGPDPGAAAVEAWVDAHLRLTVTAELQ